MSNPKKNNRFDALKGEKDNVFTKKNNRFNKPPQENSRWKRDDEEKSNCDD